MNRRSYMPGQSKARRTRGGARVRQARAQTVDIEEPGVAKESGLLHVKQVYHMVTPGSASRMWSKTTRVPVARPVEFTTSEPVGRTRDRVVLCAAGVLDANNETDAGPGLQGHLVEVGVDAPFLGEDEVAQEVRLHAGVPDGVVCLPQMLIVGVVTVDEPVGPVGPG